MTISVDTGEQIAGDNGATTTLQATISTSGTQRVLVAMVAATASPSSQISSITDTAGLTWHQRMTILNADSTGSHFQSAELWWALAPTQLTNNVITFTWSNPGTKEANVIAVAGAYNPSSPWDTGVVLSDRPNSNSAVGSDTTPFSKLTTASADSLAVYFSVCRAVHNCAPPTGFTQMSLNNVEPVAGDYRTYGRAGYKHYTSTVSALTLSDTGGATSPWEAFSDALAGSAPPAAITRSFGTAVC